MCYLSWGHTEWSGMGDPAWCLSHLPFYSNIMMTLSCIHSTSAPLLNLFQHNRQSFSTLFCPSWIFFQHAHKLCQSADTLTFINHDVHYSTDLWKYWKCQARAEFSIRFIFWNVSLVLWKEVGELLQSITSNNHYDLFKERRIGVAVHHAE